MAGVISTAVGKSRLELVIALVFTHNLGLNIRFYGPNDTTTKSCTSCGRPVRSVEGIFLSPPYRYL